MINKIQPGTPSFQAARVNILATADNHGNLMSIPRLLKTVENNADKIFPKAGERSTLNFAAFVGDWFINPSKKGFITHPELSNGDLQNLALIKTIDMIRETVHSVAKKPMFFFKALYEAGNHCFDAGDKFLLNVLKKNPMTSLVTNINIEKSPALQEAMRESGNIVKSAVYDVPDDKNPDLIHKILFLGVNIPSMPFYCPGLLKGIEYFDSCGKKDADLTEDSIQGTIKAVKNEVDTFKKENPKGAVILLSHMGGRLSEIICKNVPQINHVFNGHDHENIQSNVGKTSINSLGKDNEIFKAVSFEFDDNGDLSKVSMTPYFPGTTVADGLEKHPMQIFLQEFLAKDLKPLVSLGELKENDDSEILNTKESSPEILNSYLLKSGVSSKYDLESILKFPEIKKILEEAAFRDFEESHLVERGLTKLTYGNEIRYSNSYLMNYLTSAIKRTIRDKIDSEIFTVGIQSSIVRSGIEDKANNLNVMKVFDGVSEDLSKLKIGNIKGEELVGLITENVISNIKAPTRNTLIHWSDVQVNYSMISDIKSGNSMYNYSDAIRVRNPLTKQFEPIDLNQEYKMAIGEKYLVKNDIEWPAKIRDRFKSIDKTYDQLFREYISGVGYKLFITPKTKEQRFI